jgi:hypothetical protein
MMLLIPNGLLSLTLKKGVVTRVSLPTVLRAMVTVYFLCLSELKKGIIFRNNINHFVFENDNSVFCASFYLNF